MFFIAWIYMGMHGLMNVPGGGGIHVASNQKEPEHIVIDFCLALAKLISSQLDGNSLGCWVISIIILNRCTHIIGSNNWAVPPFIAQILSGGWVTLLSWQAILFLEGFVLPKGATGVDINPTWGTFGLGPIMPLMGFRLEGFGRWTNEGWCFLMGLGFPIKLLQLFLLLSPFLFIQESGNKEETKNWKICVAKPSYDKTFVIQHLRFFYSVGQKWQRCCYHRSPAEQYAPWRT